MLELKYDHRPTNVYPHWLSWHYPRHGANLGGPSKFYDCDISDWLFEEIGQGSIHSGGSKDQKWWANIPCKEVGFRSKDDAMKFKLYWSGHGSN